MVFALNGDSRRDRRVQPIPGYPELRTIRAENGPNSIGLANESSDSSKPKDIR